MPSSDPRAPAIGTSRGRATSASPARSAAGSGSARNASRQCTSATTPITGMPTIHAVGGPANACATTRVRRPGSLQAATAATPAASSVAIPAHSGTCAAASSANVGAAALATDPAASSALPTPSRARGENRVSARPAASATSAASGAATIRSCPACGDRDPEVVGDVAQDRRQHEHARLAGEQRQEEHERGRRERVAAGCSSIGAGDVHGNTGSPRIAAATMEQSRLSRCG